MRRLVLTSVVLAGLSLAATAQGPKTEALVTVPLPPQARFPEGIALHPVEDLLYTASAETGAVVELTLTGDKSRVVVPPGVLVPSGSQTFPVALGMKVDAANRLWIAGGRTGRIFVVDIRSGALLKRLTVPDASASLLNDVALVNGAAYFTDTRQPTLWRVSAQGTQIGEVEAWTTFADTPIQYGGDANLNGIAATPDGSGLIVGHMALGQLFYIDIGSKAIRQFNTTGVDLTGADGLVLDGGRIYVIRQPAREIVALEIVPDPLAVKAVARFRDPLLAWPATGTIVGQWLVVVNSQFNARVTKSAKEPFSFTAVPLSRFVGPR